jgi:hypothetical protein
MELLQVRKLVPDFLEAEGVELLALRVLDVSERAFCCGDFWEVVKKRVEEFRGDGVFVRDWLVTNLLHSLEFGVLENLGEDPLFLGVGERGVEVMKGWRKGWRKGRKLKMVPGTVV